MQEKIRDYTLKKGADLVGFSDAEDWADAPQGFRPKDIMPTAKGVIVLAKSMAVGTVYSNHQAIYTAQHGNMVHIMDTLANDAAVFLEKSGGTAIPIPSEGPYLHWEEDQKYGMLCRSNAVTRSARGHSMVKCWECRAACHFPRLDS